MSLFTYRNLKKVVLIIMSGLILSGAVLAIGYYQGLFGDHIVLYKSSFNDLPQWQADHHSQAFIAFKASCAEIITRTNNTSSNNDWRAICIAARSMSQVDDKSAKNFFEKWFVPYQLKNNYNPKTLFTGYYLPLIKGSLKKEHGYNIPIYSVPHNLIKVRLNLFKKEFANNKALVGRIQGKELVPYFDRKAINDGAISQVANVIMWTDNPIDLFFAQIQGSSLVQLANGTQLLLGYAADNGRKYTAIGKILVARKILPKKDITMQAIRDWLQRHPNLVAELLNQDESYVFFHLLHQQSPVGTENVPLTPERSLAVDTHHIPLGAPVWLDTTIQVPNQINPQPFTRLMIAQDTGGAITGMHSDIYWGAGEQAAYLAGHLKNRGKCWILLPKTNTNDAHLSSNCRHRKGLC